VIVALLCAFETPSRVFRREMDVRDHQLRRALRDHDVPMHECRALVGADPVLLNGESDIAQHLRLHRSNEMTKL
jgi:hypothetical protein